MGKLTTALNGLFKKFEVTEKRYQEALEVKQELLVEVSAELAEKQAGLKDLHKMYLLGDLSEPTYIKEAEKAETLQKQVNEIQHEMTLMNEYKTDDFKAVLAEMEEKRKELGAEVNDAVNALHLELLQAKHTYLKAMIDVNTRYNAIVLPTTKVEALKDKLGIKNRLHYQTGSYEKLSMYSVAGGRYINLMVDTKAVHDALNYGRMDYQLQQELKKQGKHED